ncbi:unnamed protein product [Effrenium voratum]|uniref:Uncharacterized protein n=1 Tax=Effrenium voratum TaxID=2562239 RepID=A0AA36HYE3_9DINO|nr:unnamed protein product [Effrenium voratum]
MQLLNSRHAVQALRRRTRAALERDLVFLESEPVGVQAEWAEARSLTRRFLKMAAMFDAAAKKDDDSAADAAAAGEAQVELPAGRAQLLDFFNGPWSGLPLACAEAGRASAGPLASEKGGPVAEKEGPLAGVASMADTGPQAAGVSGTGAQAALFGNAALEFLLQRRSRNTGFADWMHSLAPADARRVILNKADAFGTTSADAQVQQMSSVLVSDAYGWGSDSASEAEEVEANPARPGSAAAASSGPAPPAKRKLQSRAIPWGPFQIAPIVPAAGQSGWGAICGQHCDQGNTLSCKKAVSRSSALTDADCVLRLKRWLLAGHSDQQWPSHRRRSHHVELGDKGLQDLADGMTEAEMDELVVQEVWQGKKVKGVWKTVGRVGVLTGEQYEDTNMSQRTEEHSGHGPFAEEALETKREVLQKVPNDAEEERKAGGSSNMDVFINQMAAHGYEGQPVLTDSAEFGLPAQLPATLMRDLSQSIARANAATWKAEDNKHLAPTMLPKMNVWLEPAGHRKVARLMLGREGLLFQGFPALLFLEMLDAFQAASSAAGIVSHGAQHSGSKSGPKKSKKQSGERTDFRPKDLLRTWRPTEVLMQDVAGNAMSLPVVMTMLQCAFASVNWRSGAVSRAADESTAVKATACPATDTA